MNEETRPHAQFRVSMRHIDIFGHVHNSVYLDYCQDAIVEYLRGADIFSHFRLRNAEVAYHVRKAEITFDNPIDVEDLIDAHVRVAHIGTTSLSFEVTLVRARDRVPCAVGKLVWVCVDPAQGRPAPIPQPTRAALGSAP